MRRMASRRSTWCCPSTWVTGVHKIARIVHIHARGVKRPPRAPWSGSLLGRGAAGSSSGGMQKDAPDELEIAVHAADGSAADAAQPLRHAGHAARLHGRRRAAPRMVEYLRRCAAGGAGLIICESTSPDHPSAYWAPMIGRMEAARCRRGSGHRRRPRRRRAFLISSGIPASCAGSPTDHPLAQIPGIEPVWPDPGRPTAWSRHDAQIWRN